jgi:hypothetical protein
MASMSRYVVGHLAARNGPARSGRAGAASARPGVRPLGAGFRGFRCVPPRALRLARRGGQHGDDGDRVAAGRAGLDGYHAGGAAHRAVSGRRGHR